jgi:predicted aldo/keto reductase-like oxidoreductase
MADIIAYGAQKGLGVSVMNPLAGGTIAANTPEIMRLIRGAKSAAEIGFRFVMSTPGVCVALSGMNATEQVDENVRTASRRIQMTPLQRETMLTRLEKIRQRGLLICTACGYCMPCPHGVDIPGNLRLLNQTTLLGLRNHSTMAFANLRNRKDGDLSALACKRCGKCLAKCPNRVPIIQRLEETADLLADL